LDISDKRKVSFPSQQSKHFGKRYNVAWPFHVELRSDHAMSTAAVYSAGELS
jgi:hypothetical protein